MKPSGGFLDFLKITYLFIIDNHMVKLKILHRPKRKMRQNMIIFSDVKAPKRLVST